MYPARCIVAIPLWSIFYAFSCSMYPLAIKVHILNNLLDLLNEFLQNSTSKLTKNLIGTENMVDIQGSNELKILENHMINYIGRINFRFTKF